MPPPQTSHLINFFEKKITFPKDFHFPIEKTKEAPQAPEKKKDAEAPQAPRIFFFDFFFRLFFLENNLAKFWKFWDFLGFFVFTMVSMGKVSF